MVDLFEGPVESLVHDRGTTNPNLLDRLLLALQLFLDVLLSPSGERLVSGESHGELKVFETESFIHRDQSFAELLSNRLILVLEGAVQVEREVLVKLSGALGKLAGVLEQEVGDQVEVDQDTGACAERDVESAFLDLKTLSEGSLHVEGLVLVGSRIVQLLADTLFALIEFGGQRDFRCVSSIEKTTVNLGGVTLSKSNELRVELTGTK